jgi:predicted nucleotidyltransferase component of viral defense system
MNLINNEALILEDAVFSREAIGKRMDELGFNSLSKFELFIWDLEMFLQIQRRLGDKIILKGGAATQFYLPISMQRTSIDIDMICLATRKEVYNAIVDIESELGGTDEYCKFRLYEPKNPKVGLEALVTYFETVPSICDVQELFASKGKQEVKIEFMYSNGVYGITKIRRPTLFALETSREFNILSFENLFADKLTTIGPNTIGVSDERADEQIKQIYDVITLFISNYEQVFRKKELIKALYEKVAYTECVIHGIEYNLKKLTVDLKLMINRLKNIEHDNDLLQRANDFQSLYLRRSVRRDKAMWAIVGYQLCMLIDFIFTDNPSLLCFNEINEYIEKLRFNNIKGPDRGKMNTLVRETLKREYSTIIETSPDLFRKRIDRIIWELVYEVGLDNLKETLRIVFIDMKEYEKD